MLNLIISITYPPAAFYERRMKISGVSAHQQRKSRTGERRHRKAQQCQRGAAESFPHRYSEFPFETAAGAESILNDFLRLGKIESRFVSVAVNSKPRTIDLLHTTYAQQSMIGSGGYMPADVRDVQEIMSCGKWDLERIITHEFPLVE